MDDIQAWQNQNTQRQTFDFSQLHSMNTDNSYVNVLIGRRQHRLLIDSGAQRSCLDQGFAERQGFQFEELQPGDNTRLYTAGGYTMLVQDIVTLCITLGPIGMN